MLIEKMKLKHLTSFRRYIRPLLILIFGLSTLLRLFYGLFAGFYIYYLLTFKSPLNEYLVVKNVYTGSVAETAKVRVGDEIHRVNGEKVSLFNILTTTTSADLSIERNGLGKHIRLERENTNTLFGIELETKKRPSFEILFGLIPVYFFIFWNVLFGILSAVCLVLLIKKSKHTFAVLAGTLVFFIFSSVFSLLDRGFSIGTLLDLLFLISLLVIVHKNQKVLSPNSPHRSEVATPQIDR